MLDSLDTLIAFVVIMLVVSMLITIAVQILAALVNLRGINLARGLNHTLNTILPGFEGQARGFTNRILSGRLLSDSLSHQRLGRCATAVRPDEVFDSLQRIVTGRREATADVRENARRLLKGLGVSDAILDTATIQVAIATDTAQQLTDTVQQLRDAATTTIAQLPPDQREPVQAALNAITNRLNAYEMAAAQQLQQNAAAVAQAFEDAAKKFRYWFEVSQERAQQWFTTHTRFFTIGFAIVFAFWLQLDTVDIFKLVSSNRAVRDSLVAQAGIVTKQAEKILGNSASVLEVSFKAWQSALTDEKAKAATASLEVASTDSREALERRVKEALEKAQVDKVSALLGDLDKIINKTAQDSLKESTKQLSEVKLDLNNTGFALFPPDGKGRWGDSWCDGFGDHCWGMIFSAALLSLGAPFWFNVLKNLANLRSRVAANISTEKKGEQIPPGAIPEKAEGAAPPTVSPASVALPAAH